MFRLLWRSALPCFPSPASTRNMLLTCSWQVLRALVSRAIGSSFSFFFGPKSPLPAVVMWHKPDQKGPVWATFSLLSKCQIKISLGSGVLPCTPIWVTFADLKKVSKSMFARGSPHFGKGPREKVFFVGGLPIGGFRIP